MAKKRSDIFANIAHIQVTESAANTLTFQKLETGISLFEKVAWIIHKVEYYPSNVSGAVQAGDDKFEMAVTVSDQISSLALNLPAVVDYMAIREKNYTSVGFENTIEPFGRLFTDLPGGGLIVPPNPIYLACKGTSLGAAQTLDARLFYTTYELAAEEYWELVESRRIISSS